MKKSLLFSVVSVALFACSDDSSNSDDSDTSEVITDSSPTVDAGTDQAVNEGDSVSLTATIEDDGTYTVSWSQIGGSTTATLSQTNSVSLVFTAPDVDADDVLIFEVTVDDGVNESVSDSVSVTVSDITGNDDSDSDVDTSVWILNETGELSDHILDSSTGIGVEVNVQSVDVEDVNGKDYVVVSSQGIPNYKTTITQDVLDGLISRPKASSDFVGGAPSVELGDIVSFGENVGYASNNNCTVDYGYGYWPPGPECPTQDERTVLILKENTVIFNQANDKSHKLANIEKFVVLRLNSAMLIGEWAQVKTQIEGLVGFVNSKEVWGL